MRVIHTNAATAAIRVAADEAVPNRGLLYRDLISVVGDMYQFQGKPPIVSGPGVFPVIPFQAGVAMLDGNRIPIQQLIIFPDGDAVVAADTDSAVLVMEDFLRNLNERLDYRFHTVEPEWIFSSALIVEFDKKFVERIVVFDVIQRAATEATSSRHGRYHLKRLAFDVDAGPEPDQPRLVSQFARSDFSIERRVAVPFERNIFFSTAPLKTPDHVAYLERIEREAISTSG